MRHLILALIVAVCPVGAAAQDTRLQSLDTTEDGRIWESVGRLDIDGKGFCTGALIAPNLVLTAAHCLYDKYTKSRIDYQKVEFLAGWRNGRASAYRHVRRAVVHPSYIYDGAASSERVRHDVALLELQRPIRNTTVVPFETAGSPRMGDKVGVVSYAHDRAEAPSLQELCGVMARQEGVLVMSCSVDFGSSGAPIFSFSSGKPRIVSVVSAKAEMGGVKVSLGAAVDLPLQVLRAELAAGKGFAQGPAPGQHRIVVGGARRNTGAKFIKP